MRWSYKLGWINGIRIEVHALFALTLLAAAIDGWWRLGGLPGAAYGLLTICLIFAAVLVHELAHVQQARRHHIIVRRIVLMPLGGVAELSALPEDPWVEFRVAIAGPVANLALAFMFTGLSLVVLQAPPWAFSVYDLLVMASVPSFAGFFIYLALINLALAVLNMIPVFPLDGGRVLRSLLAAALPKHLATNATAWLSGIAALVLLAAGVFGRETWPVSASLGLVFLAMVLLVGTGQEGLTLFVRRQLEKNTVADLLFQPSYTVRAGDLLSEVEASDVFDRQSLVPVVSGRRVVGLIRQADVTRAMRQDGLTTVAHAMQGQFSRIPHDVTLWEAQQYLATSSFKRLPVVKDRELVGMLAATDIWQRRLASNHPGDDLTRPLKRHS